jgi:hypothetical protein
MSASIWYFRAADVAAEFSTAGVAAVPSHVDRGQHRLDFVRQREAERGSVHACEPRRNPPIRPPELEEQPPLLMRQSSGGCLVLQDVPMQVLPVRRGRRDRLHEQASLRLACGDALEQLWQCGGDDGFLPHGLGFLGFCFQYIPTNSIPLECCAEAASKSIALANTFNKLRSVGKYWNHPGRSLAPLKQIGARTEVRPDGL